MVRDGDPVVVRFRGFQDDVTTNLVHHPISPSAAQNLSEMRAGDIAGIFMRRAGSRLDEVKANSVRPRPIEKECRGHLKHILAQLIPCVGFGEDAFRKAFGAVATVRLLDDLEREFRHASMIRNGASPIRRLGGLGAS